MEKECRKDSAVPPLIITLVLTCALALVVNVDARVFPPRRYHISPRTKFKGGEGGEGVASFPVPRRYALECPLG